MTYDVKCDECKATIGQTTFLGVSAAGGLCEPCRNDRGLVALIDEADQTARTIADTLRHVHLKDGDRIALERVRLGLISAIRITQPHYGTWYAVAGTSAH